MIKKGVNIIDNNILELIKDKTFVLDIKQKYFDDLHNKKIKGFDNLKDFILTELNKCFFNYIDSLYSVNDINHQFMTKIREQDFYYLQKECADNEDDEYVFMITNNILVSITYCNIKNHYIIDVEYYYYVPFADTDEALNVQIFSFNVM